MIDPTTYRAYQCEDNRYCYTLSRLTPAARAIIDVLCTDEFFLGVKRIDYGQTFLSLDVIASHRHLTVDYLNRILQLIEQHYGRTLRLFIDMSDWTEYERPYMLALVQGIDSEAVQADDYKSLEPHLFAFQHPGVPIS